MATLDIGTSKICATFGELTETGQMRVKGLGTSISSGIKNSGIENAVEVTASIKRAMLRAERMCGLVADQVLLSFSGAFFRFEIGEGELGLAQDFEVHQEDSGQLVEHIGKQLKKTGEKILHLVPLFFKVDGAPPCGNPVGLSGKILEARVLAILVNEEVHSQFIKCCQRAGIKVSETIFPILANYELLSERLKNKNILIVDCGGKVTEVGLFKNKNLTGAAVIKIGSAHISQDIAFALEISLPEAEKIKVFETEKETARGDGFIRIEEKGQEKEKKIPFKFVKEIITARLREIFKLVKAELNQMIESPTLEEVILTGGGSLLSGVEEIASQVLGLPVNTERIKFNEELVASPVYAVVGGLLFYGARKGLVKAVAPSSKNIIYQMVGETKKWFQDFF